MESFNTKFRDYCLSGHAMLSVNTHEKDRAIEEIKQSIDRNILSWSVASGWKILKILRGVNPEINGINEANTDAVAALTAIDNFPEETICILKDFGPYVDKDTCSNFDLVIGMLDAKREALSNNGQTIVFVGADFKVPNALKHDITTMDFDLPTYDDIVKQIKFVCDGVELKDGTKFVPDETNIPLIANACKGMTQQETLDRVALAIRKHKDLNDDAVQTIIREKGAVIRSSGLLDFVEPPDGGLDLVGGYQALKNHVKLDKPCFSKKAVDFGIDFPKGILLAGVSGCGKTLLSAAISSEFGFPMISMDVGSLMAKYVGESEGNMREAIRTIESVAPCVLLVDEIEKGFGGGDLDGGSSKRVFGTFLKWLNDHKSAVYVIATANEVQSLPPEIFRKGRFDEIFGLDLPSHDERRDIFDIHISKRNRTTEFYELTSLATSTEGFTGADIEQVVKLALKIAFCQEKELSRNHLETAIDSIVPLIKTEPERVDKIRTWCKTHAKEANPVSNSVVAKSSKRKVTV